VVVGDQSSGKSSLLEGLTGLPFPVDSDLGTRFATTVVFRRAPAGEEAVKVTIIPSSVTWAGAKSKSCEEFECTLPAGDFGGEAFERILQQVCCRPGLLDPS
jgi:GTPase SAR1 family protein